MPCLNCGKDTPAHKLTGSPLKFCGAACRSTWHSREWRKLKGREYLDYHAAKMRERRLRVQGPKRPRDDLWRGKEVSVVPCAFCGKDFERTRQPNVKVYCTLSCRRKAKKARERPGYKPFYRDAPKAPKPPKGPACFGCEHRRHLCCWHPGLPMTLHSEGSVSVLKSGNCPMKYTLDKGS